MLRVRQPLALLLGMALAAASSSGAAQGVGKGPDYPLYCAGIVVGMSTDTDVRRMYGNGLFVRTEGHGGGRYFLDPKRSVTLHVEIGVDEIIESLSYSRGVRLPASRRRSAGRAISPRLTANEHLWLGVRLGHRVDEVVRSYGKPRRDRRRGASRTIRYQTDYQRTSYVLNYEAELRLRDGRLTEVQLHNGE